MRNSSKNGNNLIAREQSVSSAKSRSSSKSKQHQKTKNARCGQKLSAVLTRIFFLLHTVIALWRVWLIYPSYYLYFLCIGMGLLMFEMVYTVIIRQGKEYKWFCPSVFFYLLSVVPCLWFLEMAQLSSYALIPAEVGGCNTSRINTVSSTVSSTNQSVFLTRLSRDLPALENNINDITMRYRTRRNELNKNNSNKQSTKAPDDTILATKDAGKDGDVLSTTMNHLVSNNNADREIHTNQSWNVNISISTDVKLENLTTASPGDSNTKIENIGKSFTKFGKKTIYLIHNTTKIVEEILETLDPENWLLALHQVLLFVLVIGRWLLPKGEITRDQLSQLLLVFIGVGADILEFVTETIDHEALRVHCNTTLHYIIYTVWSASLLQFTFVLTAAKSRKTRVGFSTDRVTLMSNRRNCCTGTIFNKADLWGILVTMMLQDVPFLAFRLYMMIVYEQVHQMMIFFTGKNALVVFLQVYRLIVLQVEHKKPADDVSDSELEPLKGTIRRLANSSRSSIDADIKNASIKSKQDGEIVVKIRLKSETKK